MELLVPLARLKIRRSVARPQVVQRALSHIMTERNPLFISQKFIIIRAASQQIIVHQ